VLCEQSNATESLQKRIKILEDKIAKLSKNSSNSSKCPSSDDITKPKNPKKRDKQRKIGGQPGHARNERPLMPFCYSLSSSYLTDYNAKKSSFFRAGKYYPVIIEF
jgi:hypothetical protein